MSFNAAINNAKRMAGSVGQNMEMSYGTLMMITVMGVFYIATTAIGIQTFNKCSSIQNSQKWKNLKMFLAHTMTMAITMIFTLVMTKVIKSELAAFGVLFGVVGLIASAMSFSMIKECKSTSDKSARNFAIVGMVGYPLMMIGSMYMMAKSRGKLPSLRRSGKNVITDSAAVPLLTRQDAIAGDVM